MKHVTRKTNFVLILLVSAVLFSLSLFLSQIIKIYYVNTMNDRLIKEARLLSQQVVENGGIQQFNSNQLNQMSELLQVKTTLVTDTGTIVFDSENDKKSDEQKMRKLVARDSSELVIKVAKEDKNYFIRTPIWKEDVREGYLILTPNQEELRGIYRKVNGMLLSSFLIAFFIIILIGSSLIRKNINSIHAAIRVIQQLTQGNYRARSDDFNKEANSFINQSVDQLANRLQEIDKTHSIQQDRLRTLVENMGSGLMFIDERGIIRIVNRTYKEIFRLNTSDYLNRPYYEVITGKPISDLIEEVFMTEQKVRRQLLIPLSIERRHFEVYGAPIIGSYNEWKGILLVFHDITELKNLELMRKDFVANVSHELKTPITSIKGFSETLLDGAMQDEQTLQSFLSIILKESDRLQSLLQDLLDLSKIEHDEFILNKQQFCINELLQDIYVLLARKAKEKRIQLTFHLSEKPVLLNGDFHRLKQVFINLITNAIAYTAQDGEVTIRLIEKQHDVVVKVSDTGIGMKEEELPRIFERFYRIDKARSRDSGGTGLGLAIVKHLVEAHDGEITVQSEVGIGTEFTVKLPK